MVKVRYSCRSSCDVDTLLSHAVFVYDLSPTLYFSDMSLSAIIRVLFIQDMLCQTWRMDMKISPSDIKRRLLGSVKQYTPRIILLYRNYIKRIGRLPNIKNPETFYDKLAWYILYYRDERMRICTDKAAVRDYIESLGMGELLNECYGVYERAEDIDWGSLPQKFVIKHTLSGENMGTILIYDKSSPDLETAKKRLHNWLAEPPIRRALGGLWIFENRKPRVIIEKILIEDENDDLPDYKFLCFNGRVFCSYLIRNCTTKTDRHEGELGILDRDYHLLPVSRAGWNPITEQPEKPNNYEKMIEIAEKLSEPFPHVRVDLYNLDGQIIFGELTFFDNSGPSKYVPAFFDYEVGKQFILPEKNNRGII